MLLEVLSDFQISIPELGVIEARTHPIVVLTSNNSRELTEALKRRCLYLWLDYPEVEREVEIVRLHAPEIDETLARRLVEVDPHGALARSEEAAVDRRVDRLGAGAAAARRRRHRRYPLRADDEHHRQAPHRHRPGRRARRREARRGTAGSEAAAERADAEPAAAALPPRIVAFCEELRSEGVASGPRRSSTPSRRSRRCRGPSQPTSARRWRRRSPSRRRTGASSSCSSTASSSAPPRPRRSSGNREDRRYEGGERLDLDELREAIRQAIADGHDGEMRDLARLAIAAFGRRGEGSGVIGVDVQRIRRTLGLQAQARPRPRAEPPLDREQLRQFERHLRARARARPDRAHREAAASRPLADLDRALPTSPAQDLAAVHRAVTQLKRRLATLGHEQRGRRRGAARRRPPDDARLARDRRRPAATQATGRSARAAPRSTCSATSRLRSPRPASSSSRSCTRSTTRSASCAASSSSSGSRRSPTSSSASATSARSPSAISREGGVADVSGYTDYGRVWLEFRDEIAEDLDPRSTVIVLGDARTNGREPHAAVFAESPSAPAAPSGSTPSRSLYWNYGDSVMSAYEPYCDGGFECWTTKHLEDFVNVVAGGAASRRSRLRSGGPLTV